MRVCAAGLEARRLRARQARGVRLNLSHIGGLFWKEVVEAVGVIQRWNHSCGKKKLENR